MTFFIAQPIEEEPLDFWEKRKDIISKIIEDYPEEYSDSTIIDNIFNANRMFCQLMPNATSLEKLGICLMLLAKSDKAYFVDGWEKSTECVVEHLCCEKYGIEIMKD